MIRIVYHDAALKDLLRLVDFLIDQDKASALATYGILEEGLSLLKNHPEIGRPTEADGIRELIISRGRSGYVALYAFDELNDSIVILRVKHQRETAFDSTAFDSPT